MKLLYAGMFLSLCALLATRDGYAQKSVIISGVVVDSSSLVAIPNVQIKLKGSGKGVVTDVKGAFHLSAPVLDTLVFSIIGYQSFEYPIYFDEEDILIRLNESYTLLQEVTTISTRLPEKIYTERRHVNTMHWSEGLGSPITFFSKYEKEKRKLVKVREENSKVRTYVEVVNDPEFKNDIMKEFDITEEKYNVVLARFNQQNRIAQYLTSEVAIREKIVAFFKTEIIAPR